MAISTNGSMFATGSNDKTVKVWDVLTRSLKSTLHGCLQSVMCVAFNSTDEYILAGSNDNAARLWHLATGRAKVILGCFKSGAEGGANQVYVLTDRNLRQN